MASTNEAATKTHKIKHTEYSKNIGTEEFVSVGAFEILFQIIGRSK
jgi:hypothetical protein